MPLFDEIIGHAANRLAQGIRPDDPITKYYGGVLARFGRYALSHWGAASGAGIRCGIRVKRRGRPRCGGYAAGTCLVCGQTACLEHAHAAVRDGTVICHGCVARAARTWGTARPPGREAGPAETRRLCLDKLDLPETATLEDIKARFKELARTYHPDRAKGEEQRARFEEKFKEISAAFTWLCEHEEGRAA